MCFCKILVWICLIFFSILISNRDISFIMYNIIHSSNFQFVFLIFIRGETFIFPFENNVTPEGCNRWVIALLYCNREFLELYLFFQLLYIVSSFILTQNYQRFDLLSQINDPLTLSHIRTLDCVILCYMKVMVTVKHEQITKTLMGGGGLKTRNVT